MKKILRKSENWINTNCPRKLLINNMMQMGIERKKKLIKLQKKMKILRNLDKMKIINPEKAETTLKTMMKLKDLTKDEKSWSLKKI